LFIAYSGVYDAMRRYIAAALAKTGRINRHRWRAAFVDLPAREMAFHPACDPEAPAVAQAQRDPASAEALRAEDFPADFPAVVPKDGPD
jgi:hypothetical protein